MAERKRRYETITPGHPQMPTDILGRSVMQAFFVFNDHGTTIGRVWQEQTSDPWNWSLHEAETARLPLGMILTGGTTTSKKKATDLLLAADKNRGRFGRPPMTVEVRLDG